MALGQQKEVHVIRMGDGKRMMSLDLASLGWSLRLNKSGEVIVDSRIAAHGMDHAEVLGLTKPEVYGLALEIDQQLVEAGQIVSRTFSEDGKTMTLQAPGAWTYAEKLKVRNLNFNFALDDPRVDDVTFTDMSWRGIAGAVLMNVVNNPHNVEPVPPFVCDFAGEAGAQSITYLGADFTSVAEALTDITEAQNGIDLAFIPEWIDEARTGLRWRLIGGAPLLMQAGDPDVVDHSVNESDVASLGVDEDGSSIATRVWATNAESVLMGSNTLLGQLGYPLMEVNESFDALDLPALNAELERKLLDSSSTMQTWALNRIVEDVIAHEPGDFLEIVTRGYRAIEDGSRLVRIVGIDGADKSAVTYHLQPILTTWANFNPALVQRTYHEPDAVKAELEAVAAANKTITKSVTKAVKAIQSGVARIWRSEVIELDSSTDSMMYKIRGSGGSPDAWAVNYRSVDLIVGDEVIASSDNTPGEGQPLILGKWREGSGGGSGSHQTIAAEVLVGTNGTDLMVVVQRLGTGAANNPEAAENHTGRTLSPGDRIDIAVDTLDGLVVLGKGLAGDGTYDEMVAAVRYRTYAGYPMPVWEQGIPFGSTHEDPENIDGYDEGNLAIDVLSSDKAFFNPLTGVTHGIAAPQGFGFLANGAHLWSGERLHWFLSAGGQPYLFRKTDIEIGSWQLVSGLPTSPDNSTNGTWDATSFTSEVYDPPKIATIRTASSTFVGKTVPLRVDLKVFDEATGDFRTFPVDIAPDMNSGTELSWNGKPIYNSNLPKVTMWGEAGSVIFEVNGTSFGIATYNSGSTYTLAPSLWHFDTATQALTRIGTTMLLYLGYTVGARVSFDGLAYAASKGVGANQAFIYERKLTDVAGRSMQYSPHAYASSGSGGAQRIGASSRYMIAHRAPIPGGTSGSWSNGLGEVTEVDFDMGTAAVIVQRSTSVLTTAGPGANALSAIPRELPDGSIMVNMYNGQFKPVNTIININIIYRITPDAFGAQ